MKLLSADVAYAIGTALTAGLSGFWLVWDSLRLRRFWSRGADAHDEIFGAFVGISVAVMGLLGVARFYWGS